MTFLYRMRSPCWKHCACSRPSKNEDTGLAGPHTWEIDVFAGHNLGLVVAEIELSSESEEFEKPSWLGEEVSNDSRYLNSNLIANPFTKW